MRNIEDTKEWFTIAKSDIDSAEFLTNMESYSSSIICYHCQQCAEKLLKGFIAFNGGNVQRTHSLLRLIKTCSEYDPSFDSLLPHCVDLDDYATNVRYPYFEELLEEDALSAINDAHVVFAFLLEKLKDAGVDEDILKSITPASKSV